MNTFRYKFGKKREEISHVTMSYYDFTRHVFSSKLVCVKTVMLSIDMAMGSETCLLNERRPILFICFSISFDALHLCLTVIYFCVSFCGTNIRLVAPSVCRYAYS